MIIRRDFVNRLLEDRKDNLRVVSGIGTSTWDLMSTGDEKNNFGFIGAMGQALPFALGLAIAQPDKKILLITGDGDTLMSLGSLATIANHPVSNLTVIVLDKLKNLGYEHATRSGMSIGLSDMIIPKGKSEMVAKARTEIEEIEEKYRKRNVRTSKGWSEIWSAN